MMSDSLIPLEGQTLMGHTSDVNSVDFSQQNLLISCSNDKTIRVWKKQASGAGGKHSFIECSHHPPSPILGHAYGVNCVRFSPFDTIIASASTDGFTILWSVQTGQQVVKMPSPNDTAIRVCTFSPSSALLATGGDDEALYLWDISTRTMIRSLTGHEAMVTTCAFTPDSSFLISGSTAGDLKMWDTRHGVGKCMETLAEAHDLGVTACEFSPQFQIDNSSIPVSGTFLLASCGNDDNVKMWFVKAGSMNHFTLGHVLTGHTGNVNCVRFSTDGCFLASGAGDKMIILWSASTGEILQKLEGHSGYVTSVAFNNDTSMVASGASDKTVMVWPIDLVRKELSSSPGDPTSLIGSFDASGITSITSISSWTVEDVCRWIDELGLGQYRQVFEQNQIDGQELIHLTHDSLLSSLNMSVLGHRNKLLRSLQALRNPLWQHLSFNADEQIGLPQELNCPITHEFMKEPMVAADGYSYEKSAIMDWFENGNFNSPVTNEPLVNLLLIPNKSLQILIKKYLLS